MRGPNPPKAIAGEEMAERRKECTDSPPHPSLASNLSSGILQPSFTGTEAEGAGLRLPPAAGTIPHPCQSSSAGSLWSPAHTPAVCSLCAAVGSPMGRGRNCEFRETSSFALGVGPRAESSLSSCGVRAGKLRLNLGLGLNALGRPRPLSRSFPRPVNYQDPISTAFRCHWISARNPERK